MKTRLKIFTTILYVLVCCAFLPQMQAGTLPPEIPGNPDGGYSGLNTAEGSNALNGPAPFTGIANTGVGSFTLLHSFFAGGNTAVGVIALLNNDSSGNGTANFNTAVGVGALEANIDGGGNTAVGVGALSNNQENGLTAVGVDALF